MTKTEELKQVADKLYREYRTASGETYGDVNRRYSEARKAWEDAVRAEALARLEAAAPGQPKF